MKTKLFLITVWVVIFAGFSSNVFPSQDYPMDEDNFHEGIVEWISQCGLVVSTSIVRVTDYDMNKDPEQIEQFDIEIWSNSENRIKNYTVTETGNNTGIFDSIVFLTTDETPRGRIQASVGDTVFAKYIDYTLPNIDKETEITDIFVISKISLLKPESNNYPLELNYDLCTIKYLEKFPESIEQFVIFYPSPLKQFRSGIMMDEIQCKENLVLIQKYDGSPACVTPESEWKLIERGWTTTDFSKEKIRVE